MGFSPMLSYRFYLFFSIVLSLAGGDPKVLTPRHPILRPVKYGRFADPCQIFAQKVCIPSNQAYLYT
jgi:hypothetical protein